MNRSSPISSLEDTPIPGHYPIRNFLEEAALNPVRRTYGFKAPGREARNVWPRRGEMLLPGAYNYTDTIQEGLKRQASCSFRSCPRSHNLTLGIRDKVRLGGGHPHGSSSIGLVHQNALWDVFAPPF